MKPAIFLHEATVEMVEAARFYESQAPGLGATFLDAVEQGVQDVRQHPERWPVLRRPVRRRLLGRFPYGILYIEEAKTVVIVAVMHLHRRPSYWRDRLRRRPRS